MTSQWDNWLRECAAQGLGGRSWSLPAITPDTAWTHSFSVEADVSGDAFAADVRLNPDADGTPLAAMTVTVGVYGGGVTPVTFDLSSAQVAAIAAAASDGDGDGISEAVVYLFHTPAAENQYRAAATNIEILE